MESLGKFSVEENERQQAQQAAEVNIAAALPPPRAHTSTTFAQPVAV